jgi:hypothetical protein
MQPLFSTDIAGETKAAGKSKEQIVKQAFGSKTGLHTLRMSALTLLKAVSRLSYFRRRPRLKCKPSI